MLISALLDQYTPSLQTYEDLYRELHAAPELSFQEKETAQVVSEWLSKIPGCDVVTGIGGEGVVGILRNGPGKTILLRAELDGLPLAEKTGLPFASTKFMSTPSNPEARIPVMHACGHDLHMTALLAATKLLYDCREHWQGTLLALFQPSEENGQGLYAMVADGLFDPKKHNIPIPDIALGGHCMPLRAGIIKTRKGVINASSDSFKVTITGRGGHAARPQVTIDPVMLACNTVVKLQQITSRMVDPLEPAVLTVGSIHAGSTANVIADQATLEINIRAFDASVRKRMLKSMNRIVQREAEVYETPTPPTVEPIGHFPLLVNDEEATSVVIDAMRDYFGESFGDDAKASAGSEDFAALSPPSGAIPLVFWNYGCIEPDVWDKALKDDKLSMIPGNHSPFFAPALQPSLTIGMQAYAVAALAFLQKAASTREK